MTTDLLARPRQIKQAFFYYARRQLDYLAGTHARRQLLRLHMPSPVVVVAMRGGLHVAALAIRRLPPDRPVLLFLNGVDDWEQRWAAAHIPTRFIVTVRRTLSHAAIIDALLDCLHTDFTLLDYDCFIENESVLAAAERAGRQAAFAGCFPFTTTSGPDLLCTFLLYVNTSVVNAIRSRYRVGAEEAVWDHLQPRVRRGIESAGLTQPEYPDRTKTFFDTLQVLMILAAHEGRGVIASAHYDWRTPRAHDVIHIGGVAPRKKAGVVGSAWEYRGALLWRLALDAETNVSLRQYYEEKMQPLGLADLALAYPAFEASEGDLIRKVIHESIIPCSR